jgi:polyisoprenoid-binding protein YceI
MSTSTVTTLPQLTGTYALDPTHTRIGFVARHAMVTKVRGTFNDFQGTIRIDGDAPANSSAEVTIEARSIDTRNEDRDGHLRSNDFFDMENHPQISFASTAIEQVDEATYKVTGDLTIKGTTRPVTLDVEYHGTATDPFGNERIGFEGSTTVNRKDFGVSWNAALDSGGVMVGEKVTLELEVSAIKEA